jgi:formylglycine-generating enzyme
VWTAFPRYSWGNEPPSTRGTYTGGWIPLEEGPLPVGQSPPNPFGLYDIGENVHEWCADWFSSALRRTDPGAVQGSA